MSKSLFRGSLVAAALAVSSLSCFAGGFQLTEQSASGLGNAFAGTSALAEDASTGFYNPAGLTQLCDPEISVSGVVINLNDDVRFRRSRANSLMRPAPFLSPLTSVVINVKKQGVGLLFQPSILLIHFVTINGQSALVLHHHLV